MTPLLIAQVCADPGIVLGDGSRLAIRVRGVAAGLTEIGHQVITFAHRTPIGDHPVPVHALGELGNHPHIEVVYEHSRLDDCDYLGGLEAARTATALFVLDVDAPPTVQTARHSAPVCQGEMISPYSAAENSVLVVEADLVVTASKPLYSAVVARRGTDRPTAVIGNGFAPPIHDRSATTNSPESPRVALLASSDPWSVHCPLLPILADLADHPPRAELLVVGEAAEAEAVRAIARSAGLSLTISSTGPRDRAETIAKLRTAAVAIALYPTQDPFYPCPSEIIDSLAAGVPVVTTDQGDLRDLVSSRGFAVALNDSDAICRRVRQLLDDPDLRDRMGLQGRLYTSLSADLVSRR